LIFGQIVEHLKAGIAPCLGGNGHRLLVHRDPSRNSLAQLKVELVHQVGMRILRSPQHQLVMFQDIHKAGIAHHHRGDKIHYPLEYCMKRVGGGHTAADLMQKLDVQNLFGP
jgi:hypothetical protein